MSDGPLLRMIFRTHLWVNARLMPLVVGKRSFEAVLKQAPLRSSAPYRGLPSSYVVASVGRAVRRPWLMRDRRCLREGLLAHRFLRLAGFEPDLRFGVDPKSMDAPNLSAHCWVCLDGRPVVSDSLPGMVEIYRHAAAASSKVHPA